MSRRAIRADLSALGFYMILMIALVNLAAVSMGSLEGVVSFLLSLPGAPAGLRKAFFDFVQSPADLLLVNAVAQYAAGMPVIAYIIRKRLPSIEVRPAVPGYYEDGYAPAPSETPLGTAVLFGMIPVIILCMLAGSYMGAGSAWLIGELTGVTPDNLQVEEMLSGGLVSTVIYTVILAPAAEELFFRKLVIDTVKPISRSGAVMTSAFFFSMFHQNVYQLFYTLFIGLVLAIVYVKTEKIIYTILMHMFVNLYGGILMPWCTGDIDESELYRLTDMDLKAMVFLISFFAIAAAGLVILVMYFRRGILAVADRPGTAAAGTFTACFFSAPGVIIFTIVCAAMTVAMMFIGTG